MKLPAKSYQADGDAVAAESLPLFRIVYKNNKLITITDPIVEEENIVREEIIAVLEFHLNKLKGMP